MTPYAVGIDLGTTFSTVSHLNEHGQPEVIPNLEGDRITPSVVLFDKNEVIVGNYAKESSSLHPEAVVEFVKRHIGDEDFEFTWKGRSYNAVQISQFILAKLKDDTEKRLGRPVERAVITVPAYFNDLQRRATLEAAKLAGFDVLALLNEPTAAAFAYGLKHTGEPKRVLVFDLGGGTFDVTLVDIGNQEINVIATRGDHKLGGKDWDDALINYVAEQFVEKHGHDPRTDLASLQDLRDKCSKRKISLSRRPKVNLHHEFNDEIMRVSLTRDRFSALTAPLTNRCKELTLSVLQDAGVSIGSVDKVLLAGGSTRMPMVRDMLEEVFGFPPSSDINPDEAISMGAALVASLENARNGGDASPVQVKTQDVTSHSLGLVALHDGKLTHVPVIRRNSRIPAEHTVSGLLTTEDGQTAVDIWLVQGESEDPKQCTPLGHFSFHSIPSRPAGQTELSITYRYDENAMVEVKAVDRQTGAALPFTISPARKGLEDLYGGPRAEILFGLDTSGSLYGAPLAAAVQAIRGAIQALPMGHRHLIGLFTSAAGLLQRPTPEVERLDAILMRQRALGQSDLPQQLGPALTACGAPKPGIPRYVILVGDGLRDHDTPAPPLGDLPHTEIFTLAVGLPSYSAGLEALATSTHHVLKPGQPLPIPSQSYHLAKWVPQPRPA